MRLWYVLAFFVAIPLAEGTLKPMDINAFWQNTQIDAKFVLQFIANDKCHMDETYLESCRQAVAEAKKVITDPNFKWDEDFDQIVHQIGEQKSLKMSAQLLYGKMLNAQLHVYDAHALIAPVEALEALLGTQSAVSASIGISVMQSQGAVRVSVVAAQSPADKAGIRPFDRLVKIDDEVLGANIEKTHEILSHIPQGGQVSITYERGGELKTVATEVAAVSETNVTVESFTWRGVKMAYARVRIFRAETCLDLRSKILPISDEIKGLILDLRANPGGRTDEAVCMAGLFEGKQVIFGEKAVRVNLPGYREPAPEIAPAVQWQAADRVAAFPDLPVVVLINQLSASASEIVAGALQDYSRAWIVGEVSFGKGSVQTIRPFEPNLDFRVGYTSALFYRPNGNTNELVGVTPDFEVPFRQKATLAERAVYRERELNPGALKPDQVVLPWESTRPAEIENLRACTEEIEPTQAQDLDYQRFYAESLLGCSAAQTNPPGFHDQRPEKNQGEYTNI